jgi:hypothetical protein
MSNASPAMQKLARHLFAIEARHAATDDSRGACLTRVCEKLQVSLTKFAGPVGYSSLLSRALALARMEIPELKLITMEAGGSLKEWPDLEPNPLPSDAAGSESGRITIVAHLLELLVIFIGESLMLSLLSDAWPGESFDYVDQRIEEKS